MYVHGAECDTNDDIPHSQDYLSDADIVPADDQYRFKDVFGAITKGAGAEPFISCKEGKINEVGQLGGGWKELYLRGWEEMYQRACVFVQTPNLCVLISKPPGMVVFRQGHDHF